MKTIRQRLDSGTSCLSDSVSKACIKAHALIQASSRDFGPEFSVTLQQIYYGPFDTPLPSPYCRLRSWNLSPRVSIPNGPAQAFGAGTGAGPATGDGAHIAKLRAQGLGWKKISRELGVGVGTVLRIAQEGGKSGSENPKAQTSRTIARKIRIDSAGGVLSQPHFVKWPGWAHPVLRADCRRIFFDAKALLATLSQTFRLGAPNGAAACAASDESRCAPTRSERTMAKVHPSSKETSY
jgi:hypothetical protein